MSESKAKLTQQVEHMSKVVQVAADLLQTWDETLPEDVDERYFERLRAALANYYKVK